MDKLALDFPKGPTFVLDACNQPKSGHWLIGRSLSAFVILGDPWVSVRHALIEAHPSSDATEGGTQLWQWSIKDLGSSNGTRVNGFLITPKKTKSRDGHPLEEGDKITVGQTTIFCTTPDDTEQAPAEEASPVVATSKDAAEATGRTLADVAVVILTGPEGIDKRLWWLLLAAGATLYIYLRQS